MILDEELEHCPFCDADEVNLSIRIDENKVPYIFCYGCDSVYYNDNAYCNDKQSINKLIERWNRRVND